jgi:plastocyanin
MRVHLPLCRPALTIVAVLAVSAVLACTSDDPYAVAPPPAGAGGNTVQALASLAFSPATLTVGVGETVTFAFGSVAHNVYFDKVAGAPADITGSNANVNTTRAFSTAGRYTYTCHIHPEMHGTVVVAASNTSAGY